MNKIKDFYNLHCDEDRRLFEDNKHRTEYILTTDYIDKYLKEGMKILELGAGTGAYALPYAEKGYEIDALEYVEENLNILKSKVKEGMKINPVLGDARDLSMYEDNTFDMVLSFGPQYHLDGEDREKTIAEAKRVCKKGGLIYLAYISNNFTFVKSVKKYNNYISEYEEEIGENFRMKDSMGVFTFMYPKEMDELAKKYELEKVHHLTVDGVTSLIGERVNTLMEDQFKVWVEFLRATAEREDQLGYGEHLLYIARK